MARVFVFSLVFVFALGTAMLSAPVHAAASLDKQRQMYTAALEHLKKGHYRSFRRLEKKLRDYPLHPYLEFEYLRKRMSHSSQKDILKFIEGNQDSPISNRLRFSWLRHLARNKKWSTFVEHYQDGGGTKLRCQHALALFKLGKEEQAMEEATKLWVVGKSQPRHCDPVFKTWVAKGGMTRERIWQRIELAMEARRLSLTAFLEKQLSNDDQRWVQRWRQMHRKPAESLHRDIFNRDLPIARKIVRHGVKRLVRRDAEAAVSVWKRVRTTHLKHDPEETQALDQMVALRAAVRDHPQALALLGALDDPSDDIKEWRVRLALKQQKWRNALTWIETLPAEERNSERWQYWRARILQSQRVPVLETAAQRIFSGLAKERSYHGFLSADRLGVPYSFEDDALTFGEQELQVLADVPAIVRARELFKLKRFVDARREWFYATGDFAEPDLRKAAVLASRWGWHDRAIATVAKGDHFDDIQLRFPMAYKDLVLSSAGEQSVDPAWVYGVLRQESGFMSDARSSAGALGLMQLMPQTGRMTARSLKTRVRSNYEILDVNKNIRLGAAYLQNMLKKKKGHSAMATAAYNAGPNRVSSWLPQSPMEADVWVESIPYNETRTYVKRVMAYTVIYDYLLDGEAGQMSQRMPVVQPKVKKDS